MTTQILTPLDFGAPTHMSERVFRKQILPIGSINYKGRKIDFTRDKLAAIEAAYRDGAFDFVPLVVADERNTHTMDPRHTSGKVIDMELAADGLDVIVQADDDVAKVLQRHPEIGISARLLENYERADGKQYPAAIQLALVTADPRITGMRPWEAVNLSTEQVEATVDLTGHTFATPGAHNPEEHAMPNPFTDEEAEELRALLTLTRAAAADLDNDEDDEDDVPDPDDELLDIDGGMPADQLQQIAKQALTEPAPAPAPVEPMVVAASNERSAEVELSHARANELELQLANVQRQLDERNYLAERERLARDCGIPPAVTDLARPLLEGSTVVELSNGVEVDAGQVVRQMLTEIGKHVKLLDLSNGQPVFPDDDSETHDRRQWVDDARKQLGV